MIKNAIPEPMPPRTATAAKESHENVELSKPAIPTGAVHTVPRASIWAMTGSEPYR